MISSARSVIHQINQKAYIFYYVDIYDSNEIDILDFDHIIDSLICQNYLMIEGATTDEVKKIIDFIVRHRYDSFSNKTHFSILSKDPIQETLHKIFDLIEFDNNTYCLEGNIEILPIDSSNKLDIIQIFSFRERGPPVFKANFGSGIDILDNFEIINDGYEYVMFFMSSKQVALCSDHRIIELLKRKNSYSRYIVLYCISDFDSNNIAMSKPNTTYDYHLFFNEHNLPEAKDKLRFNVLSTGHPYLSFTTEINFNEIFNKVKMIRREEEHPYENNEFNSDNSEASSESD